MHGVKRESDLTYWNHYTIGQERYSQAGFETEIFALIIDDTYLSARKGI
jgi:hypothetical protein